MTLTRRQQQYLQAMGIELWLPRTEAFFLADDTPSPSMCVTAVADNRSERWGILKEEVAQCKQCGLHSGRTQTVFGVGDVDADWMLIGEAPGAEEDRRGEPFVGRAGKLLNAMLEAVELSREKVFIANILKCRPPNNRDPKPEEVLSCENYLVQQIRTIKPKLILALGRVAAQNLLKLDTPIGKMRGRRYQYGEPPVPVVVTYHPAYLLRSPGEKRKSWQDLQLAIKIYKEQL